MAEEQEKQAGNAEPCEKCDEYLNGWKRAQADLVNYRADERKRFGEFAKFSQEALLRDLITVLDSFTLALRSTPEGEAKRGMLLIRSQLEETGKKYGLEKIAISPGDAFDPARHEAIATAQSPESAAVAPDTVLEEIEMGYSLNGKVIRPARVVVSL